MLGFVVLQLRKSSPHLTTWNHFCLKIFPPICNQWFKKNIWRRLKKFRFQNKEIMLQSNQAGIIWFPQQLNILKLSLENRTSLSVVWSKERGLLHQIDPG